MVDSDHSQAWAIVSYASRMCLDNGFNRLKDTPGDQRELNRKKICFWFCYAFDKALSLNFGRTPNFSDFDISVTYPRMSSPDLQGLIESWFDICKIQGRIYEKLYSAQGQQSRPEVRVEHAKVLASELHQMRNRLMVDFPKHNSTTSANHAQHILNAMSKKDREPFLDSEITIIANLTLVYRVFPSQKPAHPLRFSDECVGVAREALEMHQDLCKLYLNRADTQIKMYIDW